MTEALEDALPRSLGRYTLYGEVAAGGMATVHFGRQGAAPGFSKTVAIKRLYPTFAKDPLFCDMFVDEARLASRIRHPNVVAPLDVIATHGELFLVMEYVHGESLSKLWRTMASRGARMPPKIAASILSGVLHGLHAAHEAKGVRGEPLWIVHRDVSPHNVLVGVDGIARVIDFGIATAVNRAQIAREGSVRGKLPYMAPEQLEKAEVTRRTDVYAASVVLWEALTGRRLFEGEAQGEIFSKIMRAKVAAPSTIAAEISPDLDRVIMRGLARDPAARFATAREMALALEDAIPLATPSAVGSFVEEMAAESLRKRGKRLLEIESLPSGPLPPDSEP